MKRIFTSFTIVAIAVALISCATQRSTVQPSQPEISSFRSIQPNLVPPAGAVLMHAHCISVGQADSTLLEFPCGAILIDAGAQDEAHAEILISYLKAFFQRRSDLNNTLESIIITHPHIDHTLALKRVAENFRVKRYIDNGQTYGSGIRTVEWVRQNAATRHIQIRTVSNDEAMATGHEGLTDALIDPLHCEKCDPKITILSGGRATNPGWPPKEFQNNNNHSLLVRVDFGTASYLFTGDMEELALKLLLARYQQTPRAAKMLDTDVYHVGHHGSGNATTAELLRALTPEIAVISVGDSDFGKGSNNPFTTWRYGHPRKSTTDLLQQYVSGNRSTKNVKVALGVANFTSTDINKAIYATAWDGTVDITTTTNRHFNVTFER